MWQQAHVLDVLLLVGRGADVGGVVVAVVAAGEGRCDVGCGRLPVILQRQVLQSCVDSLEWCLSFNSSTEWTVYEMACFLCFPLLCTETGSHSAFFFAGFGVLQYIDKVVDVGTWLLYGGL